MKPWLRTRITLTAFLLAGFLPLAGCFDGTLGPLIRAIEYPEIQHQKQLRAKLPKPTPLIDPYRKPEMHVDPGPAIEQPEHEAPNRKGLQLMSHQ